MRIWEFYYWQDLIPIIQRGQRICNAIERQKDEYLENSMWQSPRRVGPEIAREEEQAIKFAIEWVTKLDSEKFN